MHRLPRVPRTGYGFQRRSALGDAGAAGLANASAFSGPKFSAVVGAKPRRRLFDAERNFNQRTVTTFLEAQHDADAWPAGGQQPPMPLLARRSRAMHATLW